MSMKVFLMCLTLAGLISFGISGSMGLGRNKPAKQARIEGVGPGTDSWQILRRPIFGHPIYRWAENSGFGEPNEGGETTTWVRQFRLPFVSG